MRSIDLSPEEGKLKDSGKVVLLTRFADLGKPGTSSKHCASRAESLEKSGKVTSRLATELSAIKMWPLIARYAFTLSEANLL